MYVNWRVYCVYMCDCDCIIHNGCEVTIMYWLFDYNSVKDSSE
jgi:hypothetical protein